MKNDENSKDKNSNNSKKDKNGRNKILRECREHTNTSLRNHNENETINSKNDNASKFSSGCNRAPVSRVLLTDKHRGAKKEYNTSIAIEKHEHATVRGEDKTPRECQKHADASLRNHNNNKTAHAKNNDTLKVSSKCNRILVVLIDEYRRAKQECNASTAIDEYNAKVKREANLKWNQTPLSRVVLTCEHEHAKVKVREANQEQKYKHAKIRVHEEAEQECNAAMNECNTKVRGGANHKCNRT